MRPENGPSLQVGCELRGLRQSKTVRLVHILLGVELPVPHSGVSDTGY